MTQTVFCFLDAFYTVTEHTLEQCSFCGSSLERTSVYHDGYEIPLVVCVPESLYDVVGMDGSPTTATGESPTTTDRLEFRTEYGDTIVLAANVKDGFYTTTGSSVVSHTDN